MRKLTWRRILNKKGISPIIGMVLISAVLFSVLALFVIWRASQEEFQLQRERERIQQLKLVEGESLEYVTIPEGTLDTKIITLYNNGSVRPDVQHIYVNGDEIDPANYVISWDTTNPRIGYITFQNGETASVDDSLKVESQLGNLYSYFKPSAVIEVLSLSDFGEDFRILLDGSKSSSTGAVITSWEWRLFRNESANIWTDTPTLTYEGARVAAEVAKLSSNDTWKIALIVTDNVDPGTARQVGAYILLTVPGTDESGGEGNPGFGGEGAPGGIYISLGGSGGGTSVAEGRIISFNIKNFSGRMIPLNTLRFYGVKNPSNYTCDQIFIAPAGVAMTAADMYYSGATIGDGGIAQFTKTYYIGDRDEAHIELRASSGARPQEGHIFMVIMYDSATPMSYYVVTVPIRTADYTDDVYFDPTDVFHVLGSGNTLQGKSLDLNNRPLMEIGIAFSTPEGSGDPCDDRLVEFNVAGTAYWSGSVGSSSTIYLGTDTDADGVPDTGVTWDNSRTIQFIFNFTDATQRFYYFVYRFGDGTSIAHKIPRFTMALATGEVERQDVSASTGGSVSWDIDIAQVDVLNTPMELIVTGLPCYCTASFSSGTPISMPNSTTMTIEVLPGAPTGIYPIVVTGNNNNTAYSVVVYLFLS